MTTTRSILEVGKKWKSEREILYISTTEKTFCNDDALPNLPVPSLHQTVEKYLESVQPHVTEEEYENTKSVAKDFETGIGKELHWKLMERARNQQNWLEKWWEDVAYLSIRLPLLPLCSMAGISGIDEIIPPSPGSQAERAALCLHYILQFWKLLRKEHLKPHYSRNIPWTMHQFRRLFNTTRIPGETLDHVVSFFKTESEGELGPTNVIVLCRGHIFSIEVIDDDGEVLTAPELRQQFQLIENWCQNDSHGPSIGCLTLSDRGVWAKNREHLSSIHTDNQHYLEMIESSIMVVVLEDKEVISRDEQVKETLGGDCYNRWADKSIAAIFFKNGTFTFISDHTPFDGLVPVVVGHYLQLSLMECGGIWRGAQNVERVLESPQRLEFHLDDQLLVALEQAKEDYQALADNVECTCQSFTQYGKSILRPVNIHPEAYTQMALHLAYYKMYGRLAPTYVTATTRQFYHGRTETLRSCSPAVLTWVKSMAKDSVAPNEKLKLLHVAVENFRNNMNDCIKNHGCDRHLLGLYLLSLEEGIPVPEIFTDSSWTKSGGSGNFILSTSCSGYTSLSGGVMPMCENGYGTFYNIENNRFTFTITAFKKCPETNVQKFYEHISQSLEDMEHLITSAKL